MRLATASALLNLMSVKHTFVEASKRFEDTIEIDEAMDKYVDNVVKFLIRLADSKTRVSDGQIFTFIDMGMTDPDLKKIFGRLDLQLVKPSKVEQSGLPLGGNHVHGYWRACYKPEISGRNGAVCFPYLEPLSMCVMPKRVRAFHCHQVVAHEVQHYLDYTGLNDGIDMPTIKKDQEDAWIDRTTEFNAVTREMYHSVRRLLRMIEDDQTSSAPKFKADKIVWLFGHQFEEKTVFFRAVFQSMINKKSEIAVFEFGKDSHARELYDRYTGIRGEYKFREEFEGRLTETWRYVRDWYNRINSRFNLDGKQKLAAEVSFVDVKKQSDKALKTASKKTPKKTAKTEPVSRKSTTTKKTAKVLKKPVTKKTASRTTVKPTARKVAKPAPKAAPKVVKTTKKPTAKKPTKKLR